MIDTAMHHDVQTRPVQDNEPHLRDVLALIVKQHPKAPRTELQELFAIEVKADEALLREAIDRAFNRNFAYVQPRARPRRQTAAEIAERVQAARGLLLLEMILPSGRMLREATGDECRRCGGWLVAVADRVGKGIVGDKLTEEEVRAIAAGQSGKPQRRK